MSGFISSLRIRLLSALVLCGLGTVALAADDKKPDYPPYSKVTEGGKTITGAIKMHRVKDKVLFELAPSQLNQDFLVLISIARGIGQGQLLGGMSWGDDWLWQFREVGDKIHIVRRNTRFRAKAGSPEANAVKLAYTDSVLFSLPIATRGPGNSYVVDVTPVFMSDLPQISRMLSGFTFSSAKSTWAEVKGFSDNVELQVAATYQSSGARSFTTVPDSRGVTVNVHYSVSKLPKNSYKPRLADDRVGYFLTVVKDYSQKSDETSFVRYVNRWNLEKADASAEISPPKQPIIFWMERTIPFQYRKPIREGILEWNKAFEKAGFVNAIEVRQQPDNADWDPEDVNYNTFRWITASAGFAMGPSRVNPLTGQILDADIIFDADFVQFWKQEYEIFTPEDVAALTGGPLNLAEYKLQMNQLSQHLNHSSPARCDLLHGFSHEMAFGAAMLSVQLGPQAARVSQDRLIAEGLKEVTMHEVGHTLGLRHNFKASTMLSLADMNNRGKTADVGLAGSVMDYLPANIVDDPKKQGDYYSGTVGPYDVWAIEYGYKPFPANTEAAELKKIASRCAQPELIYATDEDTRGIDSDPLSNRFDLGKEPLKYCERQVNQISKLWPDLVEKSTPEGEGYQRARRAFGLLLSNYGQAVHFASRYVGGVYVNRDHRGDPNERAPFVVVEPEKQRQALKLLEDHIFNDKPFEFPPELYNHLAATRWSHWGMRSYTRLDYPVHEYISMWQERILAQLLSSVTLARLYDSELKVPANKDCFTAAELFERLTGSVFKELDQLKPGEYTNRKPAISSIRRNLQRTYLQQLSDIVLGKNAVPADCQSVANYQLVQLQGKIKGVLARQDLKLDTYTVAHLNETADRINKVLEARVSLAP